MMIFSRKRWSIQTYGLQRLTPRLMLLYLNNFKSVMTNTFLLYKYKVLPLFCEGERIGLFSLNVVNSSRCLCWSQLQVKDLWLQDLTSNNNTFYLLSFPFRLFIVSFLYSPGFLREQTSYSIKTTSIQNDLTAIHDWSKLWENMNFNLQKCKQLCITRKKKPIHNIYHLGTENFWLTRKRI